MLKVLAILSFSLMSLHQLHVSPALMAQARWVNHCEENGQPNPWHIAGPTYYGGLGWLNATWQEFKAPSMPHLMSSATPMEQAWALGRFAHVYGMPDQNGTCHGY